MSKIIFLILSCVLLLQAELQQQHQSLLQKMGKNVVASQHRVEQQGEKIYSIYESWDNFSFCTDEQNICIVEKSYDRNTTNYNIEMLLAGKQLQFTVEVNDENVKVKEANADNSFQVFATVDLYKKALLMCTRQQVSILEIAQIMFRDLQTPIENYEQRGYKKVRFDWSIKKESIVQLIKIKKGKKYQVVSGYIETKSKSNNIASWRISDQIIDGAFLQITASVQYWGNNFWINGTATILCKEIPIEEVAITTEEAATAKSTFHAYAPPLSWGGWITVASHLGGTIYQIDYNVLGDTMVYGEVCYYNKGGLQQYMFLGGTRIQVDGVANVKVRFRGVPLGSMLEVYVR